MSLQFEWDGVKARSNLKKHEIGFEEAATVFGDADSLTIDDPEHSKNETRFVTIGKSHLLKILIVVHTGRGNNIRIISARRASRKERKTYEESR